MKDIRIIPLIILTILISCILILFGCTAENRPEPENVDAVPKTRMNTILISEPIKITSPGCIWLVWAFGTCKSGSFHAKQMDRNPGQSGYCEHVGWISRERFSRIQRNEICTGGERY